MSGCALFCGISGGETELAVEELRFHSVQFEVTVAHSEECRSVRGSDIR